MTNATDCAVLALTAAVGGDIAAAHRHLDRARRHASTSSRRTRQIVQIAALVVAGGSVRAAGLALEHLAEFPADAELLAVVTDAVW